MFVRNLLIRFPQDVKRQIAARVAARLKPGGRLLTGHPESLNGVNEHLPHVAPDVRAKPAR